MKLKVSYIRKYISLFFNEFFKDCAWPVTMKEQIELKYNREVLKIDPEDQCSEAKKYLQGQNHASKVDAADSMVAKKTERKHSKILTKTWTKLCKIQTLKW